LAWLGLLAVWPAGPAVARTVLLADFENGFDAVFSTGDPKAVLSAKNGEGDVTLVEGRFGRGVQVRAQAPSYAFGYRTAKILTGQGGTIEFWYRPDWDAKTLRPDGPAYLKDKPVTLSLICTSAEGGGVNLDKNQYNVGSFTVSRGYRIICDVLFPIAAAFKEKGRWVHLAVSWDQEEARVFADGRLLAVSDNWTLNYFPPIVSFGSPAAASGVFDEIRISDDARYLSSFPPPTAPFSVGEEKAAPAPSPPATLPAAKRAALEKAKVTFFTDFSFGLTAPYAAGSAEGWSNRPAVFELLEGTKALRLRRPDHAVGDTACFAAEGNLNPALGTVELVVRPAAGLALPAVLFDCSHVLSWSMGRTGMRLVVNTDRRLEWQCLDNNAVVGSVVSPKVELPPGRDTAVALSWAGSTIALYEGGRELVRTRGCPIPGRLGRHFFIGSDSRGEGTFDGWIRQVNIALVPKPASAE